MTTAPELQIRAAVPTDAPLILSFIRQLAEFEKLAHELVATEDDLRETLFGSRRSAEVVIGEYLGKPVAFALFFHNYSTFLGQPGLYLEDLFVQPEVRSKGFGQTMLTYLARLAVDRGCGRFEWSVLDWNERALKFYWALGAEPLSEWTVQRVTGEALTRLADEYNPQ